MYQYFVASAVVYGALCSPQLFRNFDTDPVLMRMNSTGACAPAFAGNPFYPTLSAANQSLASGPALLLYQDCSISPLNHCTTLTRGFRLGGNLAVGGTYNTLDDCGTFGTSWKYSCTPMNGSSVINDQTTIVFEINAIETYAFASWFWEWNPDNQTRPIYLAICLNATAQPSYGWIRVVHYPRPVSSPMAAFLPVAWAFESNPQVAIRTPCDADYNFDGTADFNDYLDFVDDFANGSVRAMFNGDAQLDMFDYLDFLQAFSQGCN